MSNESVIRLTRALTGVLLIGAGFLVARLGADVILSYNKS